NNFERKHLHLAKWLNHRSYSAPKGPNLGPALGPRGVVFEDVDGGDDVEGRRAQKGRQGLIDDVSQGLHAAQAGHNLSVDALFLGQMEGVFEVFANAPDDAGLALRDDAP